QSADDESVRWQVGASWFEYEYQIEVHSQFAGIVLGLEDEANGGQPFEPGTRNFDMATNIGIYGGVTWDVNDRTTLSFEGRYQDDDITNINARTGDTFDNVTESFQPRLAINHALNDDWSLYGQASSGTNPAGVNTIFASPNTIASLAAARAAGVITYDETTFRAFDEEKLTNLELGIKGGTLDNRLQLAAAIYAMEWEGRLQQTGFDWAGVDPDPVTGLCAGIPGCWNDGSFDPDGTIFNAQQTMSGNIPIPSGDADLYGVELEASYYLNDNWSFRGAFAISSAEYAPHCDEAPVNDLGFTPTSTVAEGAVFDCVDVTGNNLTYEPDTTLSFLATYRAPLGGGDWEWAGRFNIRYANEQYIDPLNLTSLPATTQVNGSITFTDGNWDISIFGNNLTDEDTPRFAAYNGDRNINPNQSQDNYWLQLRIPREIGARLSYRF
ncbi:MAG TPA: TonB-dependent receptor, partial [Gammaproteobacteria bacterium]